MTVDPTPPADTEARALARQSAKLAAITAGIVMAVVAAAGFVPWPWARATPLLLIVPIAFMARTFWYLNLGRRAERVIFGAMAIGVVLIVVDVVPAVTGGG